MADPARARKVADRIKVIVAEMLERRIKDERLGFVTVTDVRVTNDLQHASVFYTVFGSEDDREATTQALADNRGRIRSAVGKGLGIRLTPSLEFIADAIPEGAAHLEEVLAQAKQRDAELAAQAAGATYAGDADPYKHSDDETLDDDELDAIDDEEPTPADLVDLDDAADDLRAEGQVEASDAETFGDDVLDDAVGQEDAADELTRSAEADGDRLVDDFPDDESAEQVLRDETHADPDPMMQDEMDGALVDGDDRGIGRELAEEETTEPELPVADGDEDVPLDLAGDAVTDPGTDVRDL